MTWSDTMIQSTTLIGQHVALVPLEIAQYNDLVHAVKDGELWNHMYTMVPTPDQMMDEIERRFAALRWDRPPSFRVWRGQVEEARKKGYAIDPGNYISGVTIIGAPMMKGSRVSHVMVGVGLTKVL